MKTNELLKNKLYILLNKKHAVSSFIRRNAPKMIVNIKIPKLIPPIINEQNKNENKRR